MAKTVGLAIAKVVGGGALVTFVLAYGYLASVPIHLEIGTLEVASIGRPVFLLVQDIAGVFGVLSVVWIAGIVRPATWLDAIGKHSLLVYLFHPIIYVLLGKLMPAGISAFPAMTLLLYGCFTCCMAVGLSLAMSIVVSRSSLLSSWITPRSWRQWPPAAGRWGMV